jgi:hypothetical protein
MPMDGHSRSMLEELLLPRAAFNTPGTRDFSANMAGRRSRHLDCHSFMKPERERIALDASFAGSFSVLSLCTGAFLLVWEPPCLRQSWPSSARLLIWSLDNPVLPLTGICVGIMVRRRGTPRRGAAWEANKAQRRREEELERALALASSILRKRARVEGRATLNSIVERNTGSGMEAEVTEPVNWLSGCVVEEDPSIGDLKCLEMSSIRETPARQNNNSATVMLDDLPGCVVEEIPWLTDQQDAGAEQLEKRATDVNAGQLKKLMADDGKGEDRSDAPPSESGGGMHGPILSGEHLALVFELRSHVADLEHRASTMGQRLDVLLDELSGTPARHRCHMCMQAFDISTSDDGRAKSPDA